MIIMTVTKWASAYMEHLYAQYMQNLLIHVSSTIHEMMAVFIKNNPAFEDDTLGNKYTLASMYIAKS